MDVLGERGPDIGGGNFAVVGEVDLGDAVADESFWTSLVEVSERFTLLCERWAHGDYRCRWFRVIRENTAELTRLVRPRSLICAATEPDLLAASEDAARAPACEQAP